MFLFFQEEMERNAENDARSITKISFLFLSPCLNLPVYSSTEFIKNNDFFVKDDTEFFNAVSYSFSWKVSQSGVVKTPDLTISHKSFNIVALSGPEKTNSFMREIR